MYGAAVALGLFLLVTAAVVGLADSDDLSSRLPLQVPPRSALRPVVGVALVLLAVGAVGLAVG